MKVVTEIAEIREQLSGLPTPLSLVPTMGALHLGHCALIQRARDLVSPSGSVAVSIFVNPIQFDRPEDLCAYPRSLDDDLKICRDLGVDLVFAPEKESLYHPDHSTLVTESLLTRHLCGATRPGHFDGVLTIVLKLFNLFQPNSAVFGNKDFQQLALIRRMVRDLNLATAIVGHPTVRETDGLAMSSRNTRLTPAQRTDASRIQRSLRAARDLIVTGECRPEVFLASAHSHLLAGAPDEFAINYLELVNPENLQPVAKVRPGAIMATACSYGEVRLIDHLVIKA
jgi:pantoate--beta-alanine ligase